MGFSDSQHLRKMVAGSCMFLAPLLFVAAFVIWQMASDGVQPADVSALHGMLHTAGAVIPVYIVGFVGAVGAVVLAYGMYTARAVDWWMALFFAAGIVCINVAFPAGALWLGIVGAALTLVGLGTVG